MLIVRGDVRGGQMRILRCLVAEIVSVAEENGMTCAVAVMEEPLLKVTRRFGIPFEKIGLPHYFMGAEVVPCMVTADRIQRGLMSLSVLRDGVTA